MFEIWSSDPGLYGNIPTVILYCYTLGFTRKYVYFFGLNFRTNKTNINFMFSALQRPMKLKHRLRLSKNLKIIQALPHATSRSMSKEDTKMRFSLIRIWSKPPNKCVMLPYLSYIRPRDKSKSRDSRVQDSTCTVRTVVYQTFDLAL